MGVRTLKAIRKTAGRTLEETGKVLGISKQAYWKKENGLRPLDTDEVRLLAAFFGVTIEEVVLSALKVTESVTPGRVAG